VSIPVCATCGAHFPPADAPPAGCPICLDERQYVAPGGQRWTSWDELRAAHRVRAGDDGGMPGFAVEPAFAIGQRALLVETPAGNVLWDCIPLLDDATVAAVEARGGLAAIAISHPHYYSGLAEWSRAFGGVPVHLHAADRRWVTRPHPAVRHWEGDALELLPGVTLHRLGGHFDGGTVLHWADGPDGTGALLTGDVIQVVQDRRWVSFMYSYPNLVPLSARTVEGIAARVRPLRFSRLYGAFEGRNVLADAAGAVQRSAERYVRAIAG
jgi:glyoxylase-like metal-dependent hydrolase (beta-lactamase superfamily II)